MATTARAADVAAPSVLVQRVQAAFPLLVGTATALIVVTLGLEAIAHLTGHDHLRGLVPLLSVRVAFSVPSVFETFLLASCAAVALQVGRQGLYGHSRDFSTHWVGLGVVFAFLAVDKAFGLHELLNVPLRDAFGFGGHLYFPWVIPYGLALAAGLAVFRRFLAALRPWFRWRLIVAAVLAVGGAVGMEMVQAYWYSTHGPDETYKIIWTVGETMEFAGLLLFLFVASRIPSGATQPARRLP